MKPSNAKALAGENDEYLGLYLTILLLKNYE